MEIVGIIIPTKRRFDEWVRTFGIPNERYVYLNHINKTRGYTFSKVLKAEDWYMMNNAREILESANHRIHPQQIK